MNLPQHEIDKLSPTVRELFLQWSDFMHSLINFNMPESYIHAASHCERVLLYSLLIGEKQFDSDIVALTILAHAAIFHDTRRLDEYQDIGHGARASVYYKNFCKSNSSIKYYAESAYIMRYHDMDDKNGFEAIEAHFDKESQRTIELYKIFKDADALDRFRLGENALDPSFLRSSQAKSLIDYASQLVEQTIPKERRREINDLFST
ncbi:MAG: HD domain-containing protein [Bacteroidales bacterium]